LNYYTITQDMEFNASRLLVDNLKKNVIQLSGTWAMHNPVVNWEPDESQRTEATTEVIQLVSEARQVV